MIDLRERFSELDEIDTEDLWDQIESRYREGTERILFPTRRTHRSLAIAGATAVVMLVVIGLALMVAFFQEAEPPIITNQTSLVTAPPPESLSDTLQWSMRILPEGTVLNDVIVIDGDLVAVGSGLSEGAVFRSGNGRSWDRVTPSGGASTGNETLAAVAEGPDVVVAVGGRDCTAPLMEVAGVGRCPVVWISADGRDWEIVSPDSFRTEEGTAFESALTGDPFAPNRSFGVADYSVRDIVWTGDRFIAVGGALWSSRDGRSWTITPMPTSSPQADDCTPECFLEGVRVTRHGVAVLGRDPYLSPSVAGGRASLWIASDGTDWVQVQPDSFPYTAFTGLVGVESGYVAFGGGGDSLAATSKNLSEWSPPRKLPSPVYTGATALDGVADHERLMLVGTQLPWRALEEGGAARVWLSSDDGATWELYPVDDERLFGNVASETVAAGMHAVTVYDDQIVVVGWYAASAAVWTGTWTD